jgi:ubiquinone/menaquinone biosynthesis C-methylase UbiE
MPYESGSFQTAVAVSALEFIDDLTQACREIKRVLAPGGFSTLVTPGAFAACSILDCESSQVRSRATTFRLAVSAFCPAFTVNLWLTGAPIIRPSRTVLACTQL